MTAIDVVMLAVMAYGFMRIITLGWDREEEDDE